MRRFTAEDFRFEDRGKRVLVEGDVETWIKSMQFVTSYPGVRFESELMATLGGRILLQRLSWIGESHEAEFLTDKLRLIEVAALQAALNNNKMRIQVLTQDGQGLSKCVVGFTAAPKSAGRLRSTVSIASRPPRDTLSTWANTGPR